MELTAVLFIGIIIIVAIAIFGYCCLRFCLKKKPEERRVIYKRSTSLQYPQQQVQNTPVTHTIRYSLTEAGPTGSYPPIPPYPVNITPYPPQPPPIGFGLMPAYEASRSIVYPVVDSRYTSPESANDRRSSMCASPIPQPSLNAVPYPPPLPPTYDEAVRQSVYLGR
ncbi:hypothetical protein FQR65_LT03035 [Abscondita terminalis]|nr:hypothetical protein FQR65_LT03035 [Abscondita terminalis]